MFGLGIGLVIRLLCVLDARMGCDGGLGSVGGMVGG